MPGEPRAAVALRPLVPGMRRLLFTAAALVLLAGIQLFVFTGHTSHFLLAVLLFIALALPAPVRMAVPLRNRLPDLPGHDAADRRRRPGPRDAAPGSPIRARTGYCRADPGRSRTISL